eukprot:4779277-Amphidinium_carterae.1
MSWSPQKTSVLANSTMVFTRPEASQRIGIQGVPTRNWAKKAKNASEQRITGGATAFSAWSAAKRHHDESLSRAPATPPLTHDGSQLSATVASFRENRDRIIEQLMTEYAALRASRGQQVFETAQAKTAQAISMAHASGATAAQISAAAEAEIRRTREQSESVLLQQHQRFNTDAHHALTQVNTLWTSPQAQHQQELRHVSEQSALQQQHQQTSCQAIQSEADRMRGELSTTCAPNSKLQQLQ